MPGHANRVCRPWNAGEKQKPLPGRPRSFVRAGTTIFAAAAKGVLWGSMFLWGGVLAAEQPQQPSPQADHPTCPEQQPLQKLETVGAQDKEQTNEGKVCVRLKNGREWIGQLDLRTNGQELWLRIGSEQLNMIRPISWEHVAGIHLDGRPVPVPFLQQLLDALVKKTHPVVDPSAKGRRESAFLLSEEEIQLLPASLRDFAHRLQAGKAKPFPKTSGRIVLEGKSAETEAPGPAFSSNNSPRSVEEALERTEGTDRSKSARVAYLSLDAWLGQWDGDVEADGLIVEITARGAEGQPVPVHGMLEVVLVIPPKGAPSALDQKSHRQRWVLQVRPDDFSPLSGSAQYRCPFGSAQNHPEWNLSLAGYGAVTAQLTVPGQGTFSATADGIRVRPFSPVRDRLQQSTGARFFPWEPTSP